MSKGSSALAGAGTGAAVGSVAGPIGTAAGAIIGGIGGYLLGGDDSKPAPYQANGNNFMYGGNMSGVGKARVERYDIQGQNLRDQASGAQRRGLTNYGQQDYANNAAYNANQAVDPRQINAARAQQAAAYGRMQSGNDQIAAFAQQPQGPSAAQAQLQQGANQSFAQQMAAARSGGNAGGQANALRGAAFQQAGIMGNENAQAAQLRAQENTAFQQQRLQALGAAQQGYGMESGAATGLRSSDINAGQLQAQTQLQGGALQSNTALQTSGQNVTRQGQNDQYSLGLGQLAGQQDQFAQNVYGQQLQAGGAFEGLMSGNYNSAQGLNTSQNNANTAGQYGMASAGLGAAGQMMSDASSKKEIASLRGKLAEAYGAIPARDDRPAFSARAAGQGFSADTSEFNTTRGPASAIAAERAAAAEGAPAPVSFAHPATDSATYRARAYGIQNPDLREADGYGYAYKDPSEAGAAPGRHIGPMAQDLAANPATAHAVKRGPDGQLMVDPGRLTMTNTSAISDQQRRLDEQQAQIDALSGNWQQGYARGGQGLDQPAPPGSASTPWLDRYMAMGGQ